MTSTVGSLTDDERQRLEDEREHLLTSLDDLDSELAAGDIDEHDYAALRDDYIARAALLSRALDARAVARRPQENTGSLRSRLLWVGGVTLIAVAAAWAMATFSGARGAGETASGDIRESTSTLIARAAQAVGAGETDRAIELYTEALEIQPTNVEALTYRGWVAFQAGDTSAASQDFDSAVALDPTYPDVRVFRTVQALQDEDFERAGEELAAFDAAGPSAVAQQLVAQRGLRGRVAVGQVFPLLDGEGVIDLAGEDISVDEAQLAGRTLLEQGFVSQALQVFASASALDPEFAPALAWQGWIFVQTGDDDLGIEAEVLFTEALVLDPDYAEALVFRAAYRVSQDDLAGAQSDLEAFDNLTDQPEELRGLIDSLALREALTS